MPRRGHAQVGSAILDCPLPLARASHRQSSFCRADFYEIPLTTLA